MVKERSLAVILLLLMLWAPAYTQFLPGTSQVDYIDIVSPGASAASGTEMRSSSVAQCFIEVAEPVIKDKTITGPRLEQAIVFLRAAKSLDPNVQNILPMLLQLACRSNDKDYSKLISSWLESYVNEASDMEIVSKAIKYLLDRADNRDARAKILADLSRRIGNKNRFVDSELSYYIGDIMYEAGSTESAKFYYVQAYRNNKFNKNAFTKLVEISSSQINPATYLEFLRLVIREDPMNLEAALNFAEYAESLQLFDVAASGYRYCADLFSYLYPESELPPNIYLPWALSCYNTERAQHICMQIAEHVRSTGRFDLMLEAIAGKAAANIGQQQQSEQILKDAEVKALQILNSIDYLTSDSLNKAGNSQVSPKQMTWFYAMVLSDPEKALDWANKTYSKEPDSPVTQSLLCYALVLNNQSEWAKPLISGSKRTQIGDLVAAILLIKQGQLDQAVVTLKSAIARDPSSLAAQQAKKLLARQNAEYIPPVSSDVVITVLTAALADAFIPRFRSPDKLLSVQFNVGGEKYSYGSDIEGTIAITNHSNEPILISENSMFGGRIRIDARVTGDLNRLIYNVINQRILSQPEIEPGRSLLIPVNLITGEVKRLLVSYPQATLNIEFTLYIDPVTTVDGKISNRLVDIKPNKVKVERPGIDLTSKYIRSQFNMIGTGSQGQKIKIAELFLGLLIEQQAMEAHGALYRFKYADWMPILLENALVTQSGLLLNPEHGEWIVKVHTMAGMLSLRLNSDLTSAVTRNLNNVNWPVRIMALYLLDGSGDPEFKRVLNWAAEYDSNELVVQMAQTLLMNQPSQIIQKSDSDPLSEILGQ